VNSEIFFILGAISGPALMIYGLNLVGNNILELGEVPLYRLLKNIKEKDPSTFLKGFYVSALSGSTLTANATLLGLVNAGQVRLRGALLYISGAQLGPLVLLLLISFLTFPTGMLFLSASFIVQWLSRGEWEDLFQNTLQLLFGIGLLSLGNYFFGEGMLYLAGLDQRLLAIVPPFLFSGIGFLVGALLAWPMRSSVVSLLILMMARDQGSFQMAFLMPAVLGLHTMTGIPLGRMALRGNIHSKRVGHSQAILTLLGLIVGLIFLILVPGLSNTQGEGYLLFIFFLFFRLISSLLFAFLNKPIEKMIKRWRPGNEHPEAFNLEVLGTSREMVSPMALIQASFHISKLKTVLDRLLKLTEQFLIDDGPRARVLAKIKDYERISDNMYAEIKNFLSSLMEKNLSTHQTQSVMALFEQAQELEALTDYLDKLASYRTRYSHTGKAGLENAESFIKVFQSIKEFYSDISETIPYHSGLSESEAVKRSLQLKEETDQLRQDYLELLKESPEELEFFVIYSDMVSCLRKFRGHGLKLYNSLLD
jgi:phosphate:Na+ symporter